MSVTAEQLLLSTVNQVTLTDCIFLIFHDPPKCSVPRLQRCSRAHVGHWLTHHRRSANDAELVSGEVQLPTQATYNTPDVNEAERHRQKRYPDINGSDHVAIILYLN